jgi:nucleoid-associated protein YgaU
MIGIKIADGSFYPILEEGVSGRKKLVLTTVQDSQSEVHIDLYRGNGGGIEAAKYLGRINLAHVEAKPKGEADIELVIKADPSGSITAQATDRASDEQQSISVAVDTDESAEQSDFPDFDLEDSYGLQSTLAENGFEPESQATTVSGPSRALLFAFITLGIAFIALLVLFILRIQQDPGGIFGPAAEQRPPVSDTSEEDASAGAQKEENGGRTEDNETAAEQSGGTQEEKEGAAKDTSSSAASKDSSATPQPRTEVSSSNGSGVWYKIAPGDTLWDLSDSFYLDPWRYNKIADKNEIANPDLIFSGVRIYIPDIEQ